MPLSWIVSDLNGMMVLVEKMGSVEGTSAPYLDAVELEIKLLALELGIAWVARLYAI